MLIVVTEKNTLVSTLPVIKSDIQVFSLSHFSRTTLFQSIKRGGGIKIQKGIANDNNY